MARGGLARRVERLEKTRDATAQVWLPAVDAPPAAATMEEWLERRGRWRHDEKRGWWLEEV